jgi:hypothetical protein
LASIYNTTNEISFEVIVSDNGSKDGTQKMVKREFPQVRLIENNANLGFSKGNNNAIRISTGRYIMILNPDTVVLDNAFLRMVRFMDEHPEIGVLAPRLLNPNGTCQPSCKKFPSLSSVFWSTFFIDTLFPKSRFFAGWEDGGGFEKICEVDQPMGAALMVRRSVIEEVGMFDEGFKFWFDEVDWCFRIKKAGWKIVFFPKARIIHYGAQSFKQWRSPLSIIKGTFFWRRSRVRFFKKHFGIPSAAVVFLLDCLQGLVVIGLLSLAYKVIVGFFF